MDNQTTELIVQEQSLTTKSFTQEEAKKAYLTENTNASITHDFWSFQQVKNKEIPKEIEKAEKRLEKAETKDEYDDAIFLLRQYKRVGVSISRMVTLPMEIEGELKNVEVVVFYDPLTKKEFSMKQTIPVNLIKTLNIVAGEIVDGEKANPNKFYLRGQRVDITYEGRKKNTSNDKESDFVDIKPSLKQ
ncbi:hypothetical protein WAF17_16650 [Bernardetia sp. ABR2-2B]|uniref:hypothetical protein n=1 Tax=Bernardetia sp. ABR2-2B TaxID=3127472 RepID=UPI0030CC3942